MVALLPHGRRTTLAVLLFLVSGFLLAWSFAAPQDDNAASAVRVQRNPQHLRLQRASRSFDGDLRALPFVRPAKKERIEREPPPVVPVPYGASIPPGSSAAATSAPASVTASAPAPATSVNFDGLDFATWGGGHPPDTNGDVGPQYYIQTVNTSIGIYRKSDGVRVAAFTFNAFMSQGHFGNLCDTDNFGDPVVLYDSFEDRWIISDFAFQLDASNNVVNPPGAFQCFAASKSSDPVSGGWNFYSVNTSGGLGDYPKLGIWPDGLYMSVNMFDYSASGSYQNARVYALNKAQMYAGAATVQSLSFDLPATEFTALPANARLQTGTPPLGTPNYFATVWQYTNAISFYKFHVDWDRTSLSTLTGPFVASTATNWTAPPATVPSQGGNSLDTLEIRLMVQNQYSNIGGVESLWDTHTIQGSSTTQSAVRYYQVTVTGGNVATSATQAATHNPDTVNRFMPSVAVDRAGNMALGYSTSSSTSFPAIKYAGRLAADAANTITQTETTLITGTGTQSGNCGSAACTRWGDYSAMTVDPDGCTFWYTNEYYATTGLNDLTRIGAFKFAQCTSVGSGGTVSGTVTASNGGAPISGATVSLGSRTTTTNASGGYSFANIPAGTYPTISIAAPGFISASANSIVVADNVATQQNFSLVAATVSGCAVDTTQSDFQTGAGSNLDLTSAPGDVTLSKASALDQQNTSVTTSGFGFNSTSWAGQTFQPSVTGTLAKADLDLFCSGCTGTTPNITVSVRATTNDLPSGSDLATATIAGFSSGSASYQTATFNTQPTLTAGTRYALVFRAVSNPSAGIYAFVVSSGSPYANGRYVSSTNSGSSWSGQSTDIGFHTYMNSGYASSGSFVSGLKDANPAAGYTPTWTTLSWNAATPANTALKFQIAASNSALGPFNFVGPDGTAATFFTTSVASLSQFNGSRYLKYNALLSTSNSGATPALHDVTICFANVAPDIAVEQPAGTNLTDGASTVDFGSVNPGASSTRTFTIRNTGTANLNGLGTTIDGANALDFTVTMAPIAPVAPSGTTTFTVQLTPSATGARTAALHIASNDPDENPFDLSLSGVGLTNSEAWRLHYFQTTVNTGIAADTSDPDGDGVANLLEFATAADPTIANAMPGQIARNGATLDFTYTRAKAAMTDGVVFNVQWSDDLTSASWSNNGVTETILSDNTATQQVKASVAAGNSGRRFMRLQVSRP